MDLFEADEDLTKLQKMFYGVVAPSPDHHLAQTEAGTKKVFYGAFARRSAASYTQTLKMPLATPRLASFTQAQAPQRCPSATQDALNVILWYSAILVLVLVILIWY